MSRPYVRDATFADLDEISAFDARAFAGDPEMNWFAGLSHTSTVASADEQARSLRNLRIFLDFINRSVLIAGGRITVVAIAAQPGSEDSTSGREKLVAFAAWVPPHKVIEGTLTSLRAKGHRTLSAWGLGLVWRGSIVFKPTVGKIVKKSLKARGYHPTDHYRLEITATDPDYQGKGFSSLLMKEGFAKYQHKPITLEATTAHSRDVYAHQGFEVVEEVTLGKGQVNERGLKVKETDSAPGFAVTVMIKWPADSESK